MRLGKDGWPTDETVITQRDAEIERLRQRVKELDALRICADQDANELAKELAAKKQGQGEPVAWMFKSPLGFKKLQENKPIFGANELPIGWSALYTSAPIIPEGWQLVPVEPTAAMIDAANAEDWSEFMRDVYGAILAAAPKPGE